MIYFKDKEFYCGCGCNTSNPMSPKVLQMIDKAREIARTAFVVTSGYRCIKHNNSIGGSVTSSHTKGLAVDIAMNDTNRYAITTAVILSGFTRIGIASDFIHIDIDDSKRQEVIWMYH